METTGSRISTPPAIAEGAALEEFSHLFMSFSALPRELISLIVEYLQNDRQSLKAVSLASHLFLPECRRYLFKQLCMSSFNPVFDYQCSAWADIVQRSAEMLQFIRILEIGPPLPQSRSLWSTHSVVHTMPDHIHPSINDPRLEPILSGIIRAQSITFRFQLSQWRIILPPLQTAIRNLTSQGSLTYLSLEDVNDFPLEILRDCKSLLHLTLISVHPSTTTFQNACPTHKLDRDQRSIEGSLDTLTLMTSDRCIEEFISVLSDPLRLSRLRKLAINVGYMNRSEVLQKLSLASPNLRYVVLRLINQHEVQTDEKCKFDICDSSRMSVSMKNIQHTIMYWRILFAKFVSYNRHLRPIEALAQFLSRFKSRSPLEELTVLFRLDVPQLEHENNPQWLERICTNQDWQLVEEQCMVAGRFPALRKMTVVFRPKDVKNFMSDYLTITMPLNFVKLMPALYALTSPTIEFFEDQFEAHQYVP